MAVGHAAPWAAMAVVVGYACDLVLTDYDRNASVLVMPLCLISSLRHDAGVLFFRVERFLDYTIHFAQRRPGARNGTQRWYAVS
jgi:hypothetical protein